MVPVSNTDTDSPYLRGVPPELREKILAFHRVLSSPDNFTANSGQNTFPAPSSEPDYNNVGAGANRGGGGGFGLQEVSKDDEVKKPLNDEDNGELQSDLFRYFFNIVIKFLLNGRGGRFWGYQHPNLNVQVFLMK